MRDTRRHGTLLLLAPSNGFSGGIERVASAVEQAWPGRCMRVDLYRQGKVAEPSGTPQVKAWFAARALTTGVRARPDTVLALHTGLLPVALTVATAVRARLGVHGHGREVWGTLAPRTRRLIARCDLILTSSRFTAEVLSHRADVDLAAITAVCLPVDADILAAAREPASPDRLPVLLTVARIAAEHRYKGHFAIAESLPGVLKRVPEARWVVVGDGNDRPALQARCRDLGIRHAVSFERGVSDRRLTELYRTASAMVLPSVADAEGRPPTGEGFGLVYAEAGAFEVPSIASTAGGGAAELVTDGETGLTVKPGDDAALTAAMVRLLVQTDERERLGAAVRLRVLSHHTPERFAEALSEAVATA